MGVTNGISQYHVDPRVIDNMIEDISHPSGPISNCYKEFTTVDLRTQQAVFVVVQRFYPEVLVNLFDSRENARRFTHELEMDGISRLM